MVPSALPTLMQLQMQPRGGGGKQVGSVTSVGAACFTDCMHEQLLTCNAYGYSNHSCRPGVEARQHSFV